MLISNNQSAVYLSAIVLVALFNSLSQASAELNEDSKIRKIYEVTITNGSSMGISPPIVYAKNGASSSHNVGMISTEGLIKLCQFGMTTLRVADLKNEKGVGAVASINSNSLADLANEVTSAVVVRDNAIVTGACTEPSIPKGLSYLDPLVCDGAPDAISCLRLLSVPATPLSKIRFFSGYLPSVVSALEMKYGSSWSKTILKVS